MPDNTYAKTVNQFVDTILEMTSTGAIAVGPGSSMGTVDSTKVVDKKSDNAPDLKTLAMLYPEVMAPVMFDKNRDEITKPKHDQGNGYDVSRAHTITQNQRKEVESGMISLILKAGKEQVQAEHKAKAKEHADKLAYEKESAQFSLAHDKKSLAHEKEAWGLKKEQLLFKEKHAPKKKVSEAIEFPEWRSDVSLRDWKDELLSDLQGKVSTNLDPTKSDDEKDREANTTIKK
jgi:hypothetical protein